MQSAGIAPLRRLPASTSWPQEGHEDLLYIKEGTQFHPAREDQIIEHAQQLVTARMRPGAPILSLPEIHDFLRLKLVPRPRMTFAALLLDRRYRLIDYIEMFEGTVDQVDVPLREVARGGFEYQVHAPQATARVQHNHCRVTQFPCHGMARRM